MPIQLSDTGELKKKKLKKCLRCKSEKSYFTERVKQVWWGSLSRRIFITRMHMPQHHNDDKQRHVFLVCQ